MQQVPRPPRYLYKYRGVADAERILVQRTVRCSHPAGFNDLLDGQTNLRLPAADQEFKEKLCREYLRLIYLTPPATLVAGSVGRALVETWRVRAKAVDRGQLESEVREAVFAMDGETRELERRAGDTIRANPKGAQVLCLSEDPASMSMWYHYADKFRGVVVAFDCQTAPSTMFSAAQPIEYANSVPQVCDADEWIRVCTGQQDRVQSVTNPLYFIKSKQGAYEQEWRVMAGVGGPGSYRDLPLMEAELGGVVIGPRTDKNDADRLTRLAKDCGRPVRSGSRGSIIPTLGYSLSRLADSAFMLAFSRTT